VKGGGGGGQYAMVSAGGGGAPSLQEGGQEGGYCDAKLQPASSVVESTGMFALPCPRKTLPFLHVAAACRCCS
jgi:hypothetical protein